LVFHLANFIEICRQLTVIAKLKGSHFVSGHSVSDDLCVPYFL